MLTLNLPLITTDGDALNSAAALHSTLLLMRVSDAFDFRIINHSDDRKPRILVVALSLQYPPTIGIQNLMRSLHLPWLTWAPAASAHPTHWARDSDGMPTIETGAASRDFWTIDGTIRRQGALLPPLVLRLETPEEARQRLADARTRQSAAPNDSAVTPRPATNYQ